jgi:hypothetical protein
MKALEALRDSAADDTVREALLDALTHDSNPGVRVEVVNMLVHSLEHDQSDSSFPKVANAPDNPDDMTDEAPAIAGGSELAAPVADPSAEKVIRTLEELRKRDPNRYVRLRSAAALRQIGPREVQ